MSAKAAIKWTSWILTIALISTSGPIGSPSRATAEPTCYDEIDDRTYTDCPPDEAVQGKTRRERSEFLKYWQTLDGAVKEAYRNYIACTKQLADIDGTLRNTESYSSLLQKHAEAVRELKLTLIGAASKLGLQTTEITINALADAVLFGKAARDAIFDEGGAKKQVTAEVEAKGADAQNKLYEAAKRQQYLASLEAELAAADKKVAAAERGTGNWGRAPATPDPSTKPPEFLPNGGPLAGPLQEQFGLDAFGYEPSFGTIFQKWIKSGMPTEGWKLHVSATVGTAAEIAEVVLPKLRALGVNHKVVRTLQQFLGMEGTQAGKFITIYPNDVAQAKVIVQALDEALAAKGLKGKIVPGEKPVGSSGLVYARYGGFTKSTVTNRQGIEVPDEFRGTVKPDWVTDPW